MFIGLGFVKMMRWNKVCFLLVIFINGYDGIKVD